MVKYAVVKLPTGKYTMIKQDMNKAIDGEYICYSYGMDKKDAIGLLLSEVKSELIARGNGNISSTTNLSIPTVKADTLWVLHGWLLDKAKQ